MSQYQDEDDAAADKVEDWDEANAGHWCPPAWGRGSEALRHEAQSQLHAAHAAVAAAAGKHSNPPCPPSWQREL